MLQDLEFIWIKTTGKSHHYKLHNSFGPLQRILDSIRISIILVVPTMKPKNYDSTTNYQATQNNH
jgi:hypothetical protein